MSRGRGRPPGGRGRHAEAAEGLGVALYQPVGLLQLLQQLELRHGHLLLCVLLLDLLGCVLVVLAAASGPRLRCWSFTGIPLRLLFTRGRDRDLVL